MGFSFVVLGLLPSSAIHNVLSSYDDSNDLASSDVHNVLASSATRGV